MALATEGGRAVRHRRQADAGRPLQKPARPAIYIYLSLTRFALRASRFALLRFALRALRFARLRFALRAPERILSWRTPCALTRRTARVLTLL